MLFTVLKTTGRRIGELYGIEGVKQIARIIVGKRIIYIKGKPVEIDKTVPKYKKTGKWLYGVKVKDIDLEKGLMKVWVLKRRRYIQDETILIPESIRLISKYIRKNRLKLENYLFRKKGRGLRAIQYRLKTYTKKAKIKHPVTIHNYRHYFITELKRKGWTDDRIMKLTGHKSIGTLAIYNHIVPYDIRKEAMEDLKDL